MSKYPNIEEGQEDTLEELEYRFHQWFVKHKADRKKRLKESSASADLEVEAQVISNDSNGGEDAKIYDDSSDASSSCSSHEEHEKKDQEQEHDSAYYSEDEIDIERLSLYLMASNIKTGQSNNNMSLNTPPDTPSPSGFSKCAATSEKKSAKENKRILESRDSRRSRNSTSMIDDFYDIDIGDPLHESRQVYKENVFGSYVANELMRLPGPESRLAKIEILKTLNKYAMAQYHLDLSSNKLPYDSTDKVWAPLLVKENTFLLNHILTNELTTDPQYGNIVRRKQASLLADAFRRYDYEDIRNMPQSTTIPSSWSIL